MFYKFDSSSANITKFVTSKASPRIFGNKNDTSPAGAYTLPYWIKKSADGSLWFNEHTGNKIAKFEPANSTLIEYWIPTQNKLFGLCQQQDRNNET
jgi:streptogramin lyase